MARPALLVRWLLGAGMCVGKEDRRETGKIE